MAADPAEVRSHGVHSHLLYPATGADGVRSPLESTAGPLYAVLSEFNAFSSENFSICAVTTVLGCSINFCGGGWACGVEVLLRRRTGIVALSSPCT